MSEANGMDGEITLRLLAITTHGTHTLRILFRETHGRNETILAVIDGVFAKLGVLDATPAVTLITNSPTAGAPNTTTFPYATVPAIRMGDIEPTRELSIICNYDSPMMLSQFIHYISKRENDGGETTSPQQVLRCLMDNIDDLIPDAHGRGVTFVGDVKRLTRACGADFPSILPALLPNLIRIAKNGGGKGCQCSYGENKQKDAGRRLLEFLVEEQSDAISPFLLFLETLSMEFLSFSNDDSGWQWAVSFVPHILPLIKKRGGVQAMRSIWTDYFPVLMETVDKSEKNSYMGRTAETITAVKDCCVHLGTEGVTAAEIAHIVLILKKTLHKCEAKAEGKKKNTEHEAEKMLKSIGEFTNIGCEVLGSSFLTELRPLFPTLCSLITNFEWGASIYKNLSEKAPELLDSPHLRSSFANKPIIATSNPSVSKRNDDDDDDREITFVEDDSSAVSFSSSGNPSQVSIEFEAFQQLFDRWNKLRSIDDKNERKIIMKSYEEIQHHVKADFLWRIIMKNAADGRAMALEELWNVFHFDSKKVFAGWGQLKKEEFCAMLLEMVQSETNDDLISLTAKVASNRVVYDEGVGECRQQWREIIGFIVGSYSVSSERFKLAFKIIEHAPKIAGSELFALLPLFKFAMEHDELSIRMAALAAFKALFRDTDKSPEFGQLVPLILTSVSKGGAEKDVAFECLLPIANQKLAFVLPHINEMLKLCTNFISIPNPYYRNKTFLILTRIFDKGWDEEFPDLIWPRLQVLCKELIKALSTAGDQGSLINLIAAIARCHYKAKLKWTELVMFIDKCSHDIDKLSRTAIKIIKQAPSVLFGASENIMNNVKILFEGCGRNEQWRKVVIEAFVALVRKGSCDGDRRTINLISDLTPGIIEVARYDAASSEESSNSLDLLHSIVELEVMQPHLPAILNLYQDWSHNTERGMSQFEEEITEIKRNIASQMVNIQCAWKADKTALVSWSDLNEYEISNGIEIDSVDYMNEKKASVADAD